MVAKALVEPQEYLDTPFEFEPEWVRGEIRERNMPNKDHARVQERLSFEFETARRGGKALFGLPQCRLRLPHSIRIPDISIFAALVTGPLPDTAPLVTVEIASPGDRYLELPRKTPRVPRLGSATHLGDRPATSPAKACSTAGA